LALMFGRFMKGINRALTQPPRSCLRCGVEYQPKAYVQLYCGSPRDKDSCAYLSGRERAKRKYAAGREAFRVAARKNHRLVHYGVTPEQYEQILNEQQGACAICRRIPEGRVLHVAHDHATKKIRGLLCDMCNGALGMFQDRRDLLFVAAAYLEKPQIEPTVLPIGRSEGRRRARGRPKLTNEQIKRIRTLYAQGYEQIAIAELFGITQSNVACIVNHITWKEVA
jgi:hypothetical protein